MPFPTRSPLMGPGLYKTSTAGTEEMIDPPTEGEGHIVRGRSGPARTHHEGGSRFSLRRQTAGQAADAPASNGRHMGQRAPTQSENQDMDGTQEAGTVPRPRNEPTRRQDQPKRRRKQLKVASLNMNGRGDHSTDKWGMINNVMRKRKVAIMALQETHPGDEMRDTMEKRFRNSLYIVHSADPSNPTTTGGVSSCGNQNFT